MENWKALQRHPISAEYGDIKGQAREDFVAGFSARHVPTIVIYENMVLDGWQRFTACLENDIEPHFMTLREGEDPYAFVEKMNDRRRHESPEILCQRRQKRIDRVAAARREGKSIREIAEQEKKSIATIQNDIKDSGVYPHTPESKNIEEMPKTVGKDGKEYDSAKSTTKEKPSSRTGPTPRTKHGKNGQPMIDWKDFHDHIQRLAHFVDRFGNAHDCLNVPVAESLRRRLNGFRTEFIAWFEARTKEKAPRY